MNAYFTVLNLEKNDRPKQRLI